MTDQNEPVDPFESDDFTNDGSADSTDGDDFSDSPIFNQPSSNGEHNRGKEDDASQAKNTGPFAAFPFDQLPEQLNQLFKSMGIDANEIKIVSSFDAASFQDAMAGVINGGFFSPGASDPNSPVIDWANVERLIGKNLADLDEPQISPEAKMALADADRLAQSWLDENTSFPTLDSLVCAWTINQWVETSMPVWRNIVTPVAEAMAQASKDLFNPGEASGMPMDFSQISQMLTPMIKHTFGNFYAEKVSKTITELAKKTLSGAEVGFQVLPKAQVGILPHNIDSFCTGLDLDEQELLIYLLIRESARQRLFSSLGWLSPQIFALIDHFAREITFDPELFEKITRDIDLENFNFESFEKASQELEGKLFQPAKTDSQLAILSRLEVLLSLVEGWVDHVTAQTGAKWLKNAAALAEIIRRRRATDWPASSVLDNLLGLKLDPKRVRAAENLWAALLEDRGIAGRDQVWNHPDLIPTAADLDDPMGFVARTSSDPALDELDQELSKLLEEEGK